MQMLYVTMFIMQVLLFMDVLLLTLPPLKLLDQISNCLHKLV